MLESRGIGSLGSEENSGYCPNPVTAYDAVDSKDCIHYVHTHTLYNRIEFEGLNTYRVTGQRPLEWQILQGSRFQSLRSYWGCTATHRVIWGPHHPDSPIDHKYGICPE